MITSHAELTETLINARRALDALDRALPASSSRLRLDFLDLRSRHHDGRLDDHGLKVAVEGLTARAQARAAEIARQGRATAN